MGENTRGLQFTSKHLREDTQYLSLGGSGYQQNTRQKIRGQNDKTEHGIGKDYECKNQRPKSQSQSQRQYGRNISQSEPELKITIWIHS
ncbi:hypothetical protein Tco_0853293 [Tanacetum coccineum]